MPKGKSFIPEQKKTIVVGFSIPRELDERLTHLAEIKQTSKSKLVTSTLEEAITRAEAAIKKEVIVN